MKNSNNFGAKIIENRFIGKTQLNADDLGGIGCSAWDQYRQLCDNIVIAANDRLTGRGVDANTLGASIAGLFALFGVQAPADAMYQNRIMVAVINRKPNRSPALRDKIKEKTAAKKAWDSAVANESAEAEIATLKAAYENLSDEVTALYAEPNNFWYDLTPMLDSKKKHATASARKAIEDIIADIIAERELMTAEELQAEAQRLDDERKGREMRKKAANKAAKKAATVA